MEERRHSDQGHHEEEHLLKEVKELVCELRLLLKILIKGHLPVTSSMTLKPGEIKMPLIVKMGDPPGTAKYQEFNAAGSPVAPLGTVQYASDNASVATVDPTTGLLAYIAPGVANIAAADSGVSGGLPASDVLTVQPSSDTTPTSSTMTLTAGT